MNTMICVGMPQTAMTCNSANHQGSGTMPGVGGVSGAAASVAGSSITGSSVKVQTLSLFTLLPLTSDFWLQPSNLKNRSRARTPVLIGSMSTCGVSGLCTPQYVVGSALTTT